MSNLSLIHELKEFIEELHITERDLDAEKLARFIADDYIGIGDNGERINKEVLLQRFGDPSLKFALHEVDKVEYRVYGYVGIATGKVRLKGKYSDTEFEGNYIFTDVCTFRDGKWQVVLSQMTGIAS